MKFLKADQIGSYQIRSLINHLRIDKPSTKTGGSDAGAWLIQRTLDHSPSPML